MFYRYYCGLSGLSIICAYFALIASPINAQVNSKDNLSGYQYVVDYFQSITDETSTEEVITFILDLRRSLLGKGYNVPKFSELAQNIYYQYFAQTLDKEEFFQFCNLIEEKEAKNTHFKQSFTSYYGKKMSTDSKKKIKKAYEFF